VSGKIVFRGSQSDPDLKFSEGFYPRHAQHGGVQIQKGGQMIGGVSTAKELEPAVRYAANYEGWVYVAYVTDGIDVLEYMLKRSNDWFGGDKWAAGIPNARTQAEIAAPSVPPRQVIAARQAHIVGEMAELFGKVRLNWTTATPGTIVPAAVAMDAIRMLSGEVSVSKTYD
jgi:hypothetical protein